MKKITKIILASLLISTSANATPVEAVSCESGGEFGNVVTFQLDKKTNYSSLVIKRKNSTTDYQRDLSNFKGGHYRLDLSSRGGFEGFTVTHSEGQVSTGDIVCTDDVVAKTEQQPTSTEPTVIKEDLVQNPVSETQKKDVATETKTTDSTDTPFESL